MHKKITLDLFKSPFENMIELNNACSQFEQYLRAHKEYRNEDDVKKYWYEIKPVQIYLNALNEQKIVTILFPCDSNSRDAIIVFSDKPNMHIESTVALNDKDGEQDSFMCQYLSQYGCAPHPINAVYKKDRARKIEIAEDPIAQSDDYILSRCAKAIGCAVSKKIEKREKYREGTILVISYFLYPFLKKGGISALLEKLGGLSIISNNTFSNIILLDVNLTCELDNEIISLNKNKLFQFLKPKTLCEKM